MLVLYFGDVFGKPGREALMGAFKKIHGYLPTIDFTIINGENVTHGNGINPEMAQALLDSGVDVITLGNHAWDQRTIIPYLGTTTRIIRPLNYPDHPMFKAPGRGSTVVEKNGARGVKRLGIIQVMGRVFMDALDCPFRTAEAEVNRMNERDITNIFIDFHGEASSEKQAFAHFMDGKVAAVVGSHAHVQTADERILPGGTAAITDVGMTGCYDSVIGVKKELSIQKFITKRPVKFEAAEGEGGYGCVLIEIDEKTGRSTRILRLREQVLHPTFIPEELVRFAGR